MDCIHNARCRYTHGFYCEDCHTFFPKDSPTYRSGELLHSLWAVLNNINVDIYRKGKEPDGDIKKMQKEIGIGVKHDNYEDIITRAETLIAKYGKNSESASLVLGGNKK